MTKRDRLFFKRKLVKKILSKKLKHTGQSDIKEPIWVRNKESWSDHVSKFAALAAVLLALITVVFDYSQSKKQAKVFDNFENNIKSLLTSQIVNDSLTIETLKQQQRLMKEQNDSTIEILKTQAKRLEAQNNIWKINQKNKILTERPKIAPIIKQARINNDSLVFKLEYTNRGLRTAKNIECNVGFFVIQNNQISLLQEDQKPPFSMNNIVPGNGVNWSIDKKFPSRGIDDKVVFIYSKLTYEDEMFKNPVIISDYIRVHNRDSITNHSFCSEKQIDFIEKNSHYKDVDIEDFTIKSDFLFN